MRTGIFPAIIGLMCMGAVRANSPDSLALRDKGQINKLAELQFRAYAGVLNAIAGYSVESEGDASDVQDLLNGICEGPMRIFIGPKAIIQDNVDPDLGPGAVSLNRTVLEYGNDLFLYFRGEGDEPIAMKLLGAAEPGIVQGVVFTKLLYEVDLHGTHKDKATPYIPRKRLMRLVAEPKGERDWSVYIASDDLYQEGDDFVAYQLDRDVAAARASGAALSPDMEAYRESAEQAADAAERQRAERRKRYDEAIASGKKYVVDGDYGTAIDLYQEARKIDPLSIEALVLIKKAEQVRDLKLKQDRMRFDGLIRQGEELARMREYERARQVVVEASKVLPDDPRCQPLLDTLAARIRVKGDREAAYTTGNYEACIKATKELMRVRRTSDDAEALALIAKCYYKLQKRAEALDYAEQALRIEPFLAEALFLRARILEAGGPDDMRKAAVDYDVLIRHDPWNAIYTHRSAQLSCFRQHDCRRASDLLKEALERDPNDVETLYWLGRVHGFGNLGQLLDFPASLSYLDRAIAIDSSCGKCYLERGITLLMMDRLDEATASVGAARRKSLPPEEWRRARLMAAENIADATDKQNKGFYAQAVPLFASACVLHPDTAVYWIYHAHNLMKIPRYKEAIAALDRYIELVDADYNGRLDRAYCMLQLGRFEEALTEVGRVQRNDPKEVFAEKSNRIAGEAAFRKGDVAEAEKYLKEAYRRNKDNHDVLTMLAQATFARGSYKEAEKFAEDAIAVNRKKGTGKAVEDPVDHFYLGLVKQQLGDVKGSIACFEEARLYNYDRNEVEKRIGISHMNVGDIKEAITNFQEVLRDTLDQETVMLLAECLKTDKRYEEALRELDRLQEARPTVKESPEFLADIGLLYVLNDMMTDANKAIDAAYRADPDYRKTLLARIAMFWKGERKAEAVTELDKLISRGQVQEKQLKNMPILKDIVGSKLWADRAR